MGVDHELLEAIVGNAQYGIERNDWWNTSNTVAGYLSRLADGEPAKTFIDAALVELGKLDKWSTSLVAAHLRLLLRRTAFRSMRGAKGTTEGVMPNADACWVSRVHEAIGHPHGFSEPVLTLIRGADVERLFRAWSALDWDGTLTIESTFGREARRTPIAKRPWPELATLVGSTSFDRLTSGEKAEGTVTALFAHPSATIDDKIALASRLANRGKGHGAFASDGLAVVMLALAPHLAAHERPVPKHLGRVAARLRAKPEHAAAFAGVPST